LPVRHPAHPAAWGAYDLPVGEQVRVHATVRGRVQMVGFRAFVLDQAEQLGVRGTVANLPDGSVECVVEGERGALDQLVQLLRQGPRSARVDAVELIEQPFTGNLPTMRVTA
jgi:acylphosphatase